MSFVERNKAWLLPLLGVGVVGVLWLNYLTFYPRKPVTASPPNAKATPPVAGSTSPSVSANQAAPNEANAPPPSVPRSANPPSVSVAGDLWADLKIVEAPPPELNGMDALLKEGENPLRLAVFQETKKPTLSPEDWTHLPEPEIVHKNLVASHDVPLPPLVLDFVLRLENGVRQAWFGGKAYREGQKPDRAHKIKRITERGVVLSGSGGETLISTNLKRVSPSFKANPPADPAVPAEAK